MFNVKKLAVLFISTLAISGLSHAETSKYGVTVSRCYYDYDNVDFCTDDKMKAYAKVMKTRKPNFDKDKILYIFEEDKSLMDEPQPHYKMYYRMVVINPKNKLVVPAEFGITEAKDYSGNPISVNNKGELLEFDFNVNSNKFCFRGNVNGYRISYIYDNTPYCFDYEKFSSDKYESFIMETNW